MPNPIISVKLPNEMHQLNDRQRRFAEFVVNGESAAEAYRLAGYKGRGSAATSGAHEIMTKPDVAAYIKQLRSEASASVALSRDKALDRLSAIVSEGSDRDAIAAIARAAKMLGWDEPARVEQKLSTLDFDPPDTTGLDAINGVGAFA